MTFWQFLYEASVWQWFGLLLLASALSQCHLVTIRWCRKNKDTKP